MCGSLGSRMPTLLFLFPLHGQSVHFAGASGLPAQPQLTGVAPLPPSLGAQRPIRITVLCQHSRLGAPWAGGPQARPQLRVPTGPVEALQLCHPHLSPPTASFRQAWGPCDTLCPEAALLSPPLCSCPSSLSSSALSASSFSASLGNILEQLHSPHLGLTSDLPLKNLSSRLLAA